MRQLNRLLWIALCLCSAVTTLTSCGAAVENLHAVNITFKVVAIGGLPRSVQIVAVSGDEFVVIGKFITGKPPYDWQFFRYTPTNGIENLGSFGKKNIDNLCLSADGLVIWGTFDVEKDDSHVFRYTQTHGLEDLGTMGRRVIATYGVSADGSVVVGRFLHSTTPEKAPRYHAFKYSRAQGFEDLGTMGGESAFARGVSADGSTVVGNFHVANSSNHAFQYSRADGVRDIGAVGGTAAFATGISDDGVVVGVFFGESSFLEYRHYQHVFIYTKSGGVKKLGAMGGKSARAPRISADGKRIIGSYVDSGGDSYVYTAVIK